MGHEVAFGQELPEPIDHRAILAGGVISPGFVDAIMQTCLGSWARPCWTLAALSPAERERLFRRCWRLLLMQLYISLTRGVPQPKCC